MGNLISIIVPVYNGESFIGDAIGAILRSTYRELEVIIVDDGSKDDSLRICEGLREADNRVAVYSQENKGVAAARNYGVQMARGDYICFCDQDDFVKPAMYGRMVGRMERDGSDICMCGVGRSIGEKRCDFEILPDACYEGEDILTQILYPLVFIGYEVPFNRGGGTIYTHIWNCMFRGSFWRTFDFRYRAYVNFEDDLIIKLDTISRADRISTLSYVGYYWRVNPASETFARRFVENIGEKQQQCYEDMRRCLARKVKDESALALFQKVTLCRQYVDAVHNLSGACKKKSGAYIKSYCEEEIYRREFAQCIQARKYLKKGYFRQKLILSALAGKLPVLSYMSERVLDYVLGVSLRSQALTKLERRLKRRA